MNKQVRKEEREFASREEAREAVGFDRIETWSNHEYNFYHDGKKFSRRLIAWYDNECWYGGVFEDPETGHVVVIFD